MMRHERRMARDRRQLSLLLVVAGLLVIVYPHASEFYQDYRQQALLRAIERSQRGSDLQPEDRTVARYRELTEVFDLAGIQDQEPEPVEPGPSPPPPAAELRGDFLGTITIEKIGVRLPIFYGASEANMAVGVGLIEGTSPIGSIGNTALAGHRSRRYGRQFNRLGELDRGDIISIQTSDSTYTYRIYKIHIVEPTDLSVLNRSRTHEVLTLVTCEPIYPATHRLIVHAVRIP